MVSALQRGSPLLRSTLGRAQQAMRSVTGPSLATLQVGCSSHLPESTLIPITTMQPKNSSKASQEGFLV